MTGADRRIIVNLISEWPRGLQNECKDRNVTQDMENVYLKEAFTPAVMFLRSFAMVGT